MILLSSHVAPSDANRIVQCLDPSRGIQILILTKINIIKVIIDLGGGGGGGHAKRVPILFPSGIMSSVTLMSSTVYKIKMFILTFLILQGLPV